MSVPATDSFNSPDSKWEQEWHSWMACGYDMASLQQWVAASMFYKKAFTLVEQVLCTGCPNRSCCTNSLQYYLCSATKFAYVVRSSGEDCALKALIETLQLQQSKMVSEQDKSLFRFTIEKLKRLEAHQDLS